jgi:hypothetical protein
MKSQKQNKPTQKNSSVVPADTGSGMTEPLKPREIGGRKGPEPTRYGDWEKAGRCIDF